MLRDGREAGTVSHVGEQDEEARTGAKSIFGVSFGWRPTGLTTGPQPHCASIRRKQGLVAAQSGCQVPFAMPTRQDVHVVVSEPVTWPESPLPMPVCVLITVHHCSPTSH
jgi:hypothetical protein